VRLRPVLATALSVVVLGAGAVAAAPSAPGTPARGPVQPSAAVSDPVVTGPVTGGIRTGQPYNTTQVPLVNGYVEEEFFFGGTATDGAGAEMPYRSRILVRRPSDPKRFNGSVVLDWDNVTVPDDTDVNWQPTHPTVMKRGFVYVAVAAQRLSIEASPLALKQWDPVRYGSLSHPGDDFSFDIFSQAAEAVLDPKVLGPLRPKVDRRLAFGASQSGGRLKTYINEWQSEHRVFDGFGPQISGPSGVNRKLAPIVWLQSQSETGSAPVEPDSDLFRLWELAGPAHAPNQYSAYQNSTYVYSHSNGTTSTYDHEADNAWGYGKRPGECLARNWFSASAGYQAQLVALDDWVRTGKAPKPMPRMTRVDGERTYDEHDNVVGGIRNPQIDVPIAGYFAGGTPTGTTNPCALAGGDLPLTGTTSVFDVATLERLYPEPGDYAKAFEASVEDALAKGFILPEGAEDLRRRAKDAAAWVDAQVG
jgi:hypothetical protein